MNRLASLLLLVGLAVANVAVADNIALPLLDEPVDLDQYAGEWYVHGAIPLDIPFFSDAEARNYTEHYERLSDDKILMTSAFDTPDAERKSFSFKGRVVDQPLNATWSIGLVWPLKAEYSIIYLDPGYATTVVVSANRRNAWIMSREPYMTDFEYAYLLNFMTASGFDPAEFRRVPHDAAEPPQMASR